MHRSICRYCRVRGYNWRNLLPTVEGTLDGMTWRAANGRLACHPSNGRPPWREIDHNAYSSMALGCSSSNSLIPPSAMSSILLSFSRENGVCSPVPWASMISR